MPGIQRLSNSKIQCNNGICHLKKKHNNFIKHWHQIIEMISVGIILNCKAEIMKELIKFISQFWEAVSHLIYKINDPPPSPHNLIFFLIQGQIRV